ncbi:MAG: CDK5RAP3 family protein, partial [Spirochaetales bacterium]|nr:CDK5RAP3 family protein [Spirochaetales bacterium]
ISKGVPGAPCVNKHAAFSTEFSDIPQCMASRTYQKAKLESLEKEKLPSKIFEMRKQYILAKACICHDLAGAATETLGIDKRALTALTPGPNIINFSKISTLKEMVDHIYGRINLITSEKREHMFLKELELYVEQLKSKFEDLSLETVMEEGKKQLTEFGANLLEGISYYRDLSDRFTKDQKKKFLRRLNSLKSEVLRLNKKIDIL